MILIIDTNYEKNSLAYDETVKPIVDLVKDCEVKHYTELKDVEKYDRIIICSCLLKDNKFMSSKDIFSWLKTTERPVLGICAGMEIIALVYGAKMRKSKEIGMVNVKTVRKNKLFSGKFEAYNLHNFMPLSILLRNFDILAASKRGVQAIKHEKKEIYGVMFHPEVRNKGIIENFIKL